MAITWERGQLLFNIDISLKTAGLYNRIRFSCFIMRFIIIDMYNSNHVLC